MNESTVKPASVEGSLLQTQTNVV